ADPAYRFATATAFTDALKDTVASAASGATADASVSTPKPKARRPRTKLRVVTPTLIDTDTKMPEATEPPSNVGGVVADVEALAPREGERLVRANVEGSVPTNMAEPVLSEVEGPEIELRIREESPWGEIGPLPLLAFAPDAAGDGPPSEPDDPVA